MHMDITFLGVKTNLWGTYGDMTDTHVRHTRREMFKKSGNLEEIRF